MKKTLVSATGVTLAVALAVAGCKEKQTIGEQRGEEQTETKKAAQSAAPTERVEVAFHVMSKCPFGAQVVNAVKPVLDKLGKAVDFKLYFIGEVKPDGSLSSMHGDTEVKGDLLMACAEKYAPDKAIELADCMFKDFRQIPNNFDACAAQAKIDAAQVKSCADGEEGKKLLTDSFNVSKQKRASGSPTMFIGGKRYQGGRGHKDFLRAICNAFSGAKPETCENLPPPVKISLKVLTDKRCKKCYNERMLNWLKSMFPGVHATFLDYNTPEGKNLYQEISQKGVKFLPAFLFDANLEKADSYDQVRRWVTTVGPYRVLQIGAKFDPTAEICDNKIDDDNNGKIDCEDPYCKQQLACRPAKEKLLQVFVMSQCPFGIKAENATKEVLDAFKQDGIDFQIHFIADQNPDGSFRSLHGQSEVEENLRQVCVTKYYKKNFKFMDYIWCRNQNIREPNWKDCAKKAGLNVAKIEKCATGDEGKKLLAEDLKIAKALGIGASPTWLANNRYKFSGLAPEQIKRQFCAYNKGLKGCSKTLTNQVRGPSGGCGN